MEVGERSEQGGEALVYISYTKSAKCIAGAYENELVNYKAVRKTLLIKTP